MAGHRAPHDRERPSLQSVRRGRRSSWRVTALVIAALAVALAYVGRFGLPDLAGPATSPTTSPTRAAAVDPAPTRRLPGDEPSHPSGPTPLASASPPRPLPTRVPLPSRPSSSARYADGIPGRIGDERVVRLPNLFGGGAIGDVLLGGWHAAGRLTDAPGISPAPYAGGGPFEYLDLRGAQLPIGPVVVRGARVAGEAAFEVSDVVWTGDAQTAASPIAAGPLIASLAERFGAASTSSGLRLRLADVALDCEIPWPRHAYVGESGPVELLFVFSSPSDRVMAEVAIIHTQYPGHDPGELEPRCEYPVARITGRTRWLVDGNVMLLVRSTEQSRRLTREALAEAREMTDSPEEPWRPVTTWQALRALWQIYPRLDVAPPAEEVFCVPDLPADSWSIRHPQVRGLAVFPGVSEREEFQATVAATDVRLERGACSGLAGQRPIGEDARWVGKANVLLLVTGEEEIDAQLERAIPSAPGRRVWP